MNKEFETIIFKREGAIAYITINRPKAMNALNSKVIEELGQAVEILEGDKSIRVCIITGEGRAFVAGADIAQMANYGPAEGRALAYEGSGVFRRIELLDTVTIAAINGFALGGGCELALCCDMRIASEKAMFGMPEVGIGILPGFSGTQRLPRAISTAKAKELVLTGDFIGAEEAEKIGLVNKVVPGEELIAEAEKLAARVLKNAPTGVRFANRAIRLGLERGIEAGIILENDLFGKCFATEDQKEGMAAFLEKRKAEYKDK